MNPRCPVTQHSVRLVPIVKARLPSIRSMIKHGDCRFRMTWTRMAVVIMSSTKVDDDVQSMTSHSSLVVCLGDEESVRKRRYEKRAQRSEEKKRRIEEKVSNANQRWQKYSNVDYELVFFVSRYFDQLPLCSSCRNYFVTHRAQFLSEDPRASLDYAADTALRSASTKILTLKQAAKARLIRDYDKQTDVIFNLCDNCLNTCTRIRNDLKEINTAQKISSGSSVIDMSALNTPDLRTEPMLSPLSPTIANESPSSPPTVPGFLRWWFEHLHCLLLFGWCRPSSTLHEQSSAVSSVETTTTLRTEPSIARRSAHLRTADRSTTASEWGVSSMLRWNAIPLSGSFASAISRIYPLLPSPPFLSSSLPILSAWRTQWSDDEPRRFGVALPGRRSFDDWHLPWTDRISAWVDFTLLQGSDDFWRELFVLSDAPLDDFMRGLEVLQCLSTLTVNQQEKWFSLVSLTPHPHPLRRIGRHRRANI